MKNKTEIIVLCSGGLDSVTAAHLMRKKHTDSKIILLFFDYGQRSREQEKLCAKNCAKKLNATFIEIALPELGKLSTSRINKSGKIMTTKNLRDTSKEQIQWYVPFRNTVFLSYAFAYAESIALKDKKKSFVIVTGFKCEGKEPYPDTTPVYVKNMNALVKTAAPSLKIRIEAPLISLDKEDIVALGEKLGVDFSQTRSCYVGGNKQCGECLACRLRKAGFHWAGVEDPAPYLK